MYMNPENKQKKKKYVHFGKTYFLCMGSECNQIYPTSFQSKLWQKQRYLSHWSASWNSLWHCITHIMSELCI